MATMQLVVPPAILAQFGALIELIRSSESMTDEERQYWVNILPIMTSEQRTTLEGILKNEQQKLAALDAKYAKDLSHIEKRASLTEIEEGRRSKRTARQASEEQAAKIEEAHEEEILRNIQNS